MRLMSESVIYSVKGRFNAQVASSRLNIAPLRVIALIKPNAGFERLEIPRHVPARSFVAISGVRSGTLSPRSTKRGEKEMDVRVAGYSISSMNKRRNRGAVRKGSG